MGHQAHPLQAWATRELPLQSFVSFCQSTFNYTLGTNAPSGVMLQGTMQDGQMGLWNLRAMWPDTLP